MKTRELTVGHLTRPINKAFREWKKDKRGMTPSWVEITRQTLANHGYSFQGPFGLRCAFCVRKPGTRFCRELEIMSTDDGWEIGIRNYKNITNNWPPGSVGFLNDLQYEYVPLKPSTKIKDGRV